MIETIINTPKSLTSNSSMITFDGISERTRCAFCSNGGWLDYENGSPNFKTFGNGNTGYNNATFSATVSSAMAGVVAIGLYEDGVLLPDTVRAVTLAAAGDFASVSFDRKDKICPRGTTSFSVGSVPSVPTPTDPTTPVVTQIPIIVAGTFNLSRSQK